MIVGKSNDSFTLFTNKFRFSVSFFSKSKLSWDVLKLDMATSALEYANSTFSFSLFNSNGQVLISDRELETELIKLSSDLLTGIYLLEVTDNTINKSYHSKIQIK